MSIQKVAVIGCGLMGREIALATASAGIPTMIFKMTREEELSKVRDKFNERLDKEKQKIVQWDCWKHRGEVEGFKDCDLAIETIVEDLHEKRALFSQLDNLLNPMAIIASNTSTLSVAELASATMRPGRVAGLHFFNPPSVAKLVEVVQTASVYASVVEELQSFVRQLGLTPLVVANTPGFVVNRLMMNDLIYAILCLEGRLAKMEDMDMAKRLGLVHPMGPFELCDHVGLDTILSMAKILYKDLQDERFKPPMLLQRLVKNQMLGRKSKNKLGFYNYNLKPKCPNPEVYALINLERRSLAW